MALVACDPAAPGELDGPAPTAPTGRDVAPIHPVPLPVPGQPAAPGAWAVPPFVDFPPVRNDCGLRIRPVEIENRARVPARLRVLGVDGPFALNPATAPSWEVPAGASTRVEVWLAPPGPGRHAGQLTLELEGQRVPVTVRLSAEVDPEHGVEDRWRQADRPRVDLLLVLEAGLLDRIVRNALWANLQSLAQYVLAQGLDIRVGAMIADADGQPQASLLPLGEDGDRWLEPAALAEGLARIPALLDSADGRPPPRLLDAIRRASDRVAVRPGALLSVLALSSRDDVSPAPVDEAIDGLMASRGFRSPRRIVVSAVAGPLRTRLGCSGPGGEAEPTPRLRAVTDAFGGVFASVCAADWSRVLEDYGPGFGWKTWIYLSRRPRLETLELSIDELPLPRQARGGIINWSYDASAGLVDFAPFATPDPGAEVAIRYLAACR